MDKLTAYKVLGLENNVSTEDVKKAYARLSKEYHPEENPEEFQRIHEAYVTLTRHGRRGNRALVVENSPIEKSSTPEKKESDLIFHNIQNVEEEKDVENQVEELSFGKSLKDARKQQEESEAPEQSDFDFDLSIQQAQKQEEEQFQKHIQACIDELSVLFSPSNYNELRKFKEFFARKEYEKVFFSRPFIYYLAQYINQVELKYEVYSYLIKFYRLKDKKIEELIPEAQQLYRVIDSRYSITHDVIAARKRGFFGGAFGGILYALFKFGPKIAKNIIQHESNLEQLNFLVFIPFILMGLAGYILYKMFCKKHNIYVAMKKVAGWLLVFAIPAFILDIWAPFFQNNPSNSLEVEIFTIIASVIWWLTMKLIIFILQKKREQNEK